MVAHGRVGYVLGTAAERLAAACLGMTLSWPEHSPELTREPPGFSASEEMLFAKNRHDKDVSACSGIVQVFMCQFDRSQGRRSDRRG
jgi:hypothetical protein